MQNSNQIRLTHRQIQHLLVMDELCEAFRLNFIAIERKFSTAGLCSRKLAAILRYTSGVISVIVVDKYDNPLTNPEFECWWEKVRPGVWAAIAKLRNEKDSSSVHPDLCA